MNQFDIQILLIFKQIFKGHCELGEKILYILKQTDIELIRKDYIETHFYNWLIGDLVQRKTAHDSQIGSRVDFYDKNKKILGLNHTYTRTKGLMDCFKSPWWKTMNYIILSRRLINETINSEIDIKVSNIPVNLNHNTEIILVSDLWRKVTFKEKVHILDKYIYCDHIDDRIVEVYISCDYSSFCYLL